MIENMDMFRHELDEFDDYVKEYEQMGMQHHNNNNNNQQQRDENLTSPEILSESGKSPFTAITRKSSLNA